MKIKGIDLYKRVLEEDETILGKVFEFDDMKMKVVNTFGNRSNEWGLAEMNSDYFYINHILYNLSKGQIDEIFKAEWTEVRQAVSFIEAVESGERLMVEHDLLSGEGIDYFKNFNSLDGLMYEICAVFGADEVRQIIVKGKWYIG